MWLRRAFTLSCLIWCFVCTADNLCYVVDAEIDLTERMADLMRTPRMSADLARAGNELLLRALKQKEDYRPEGITREQARELFLSVATHPVASLVDIKKYDPEGCWGFCMGRALAAKILADRMKIPPENILKIWAVGTIVTPAGKSFRGHVATIVKAKEGGWYVIDPESGSFTTPDSWYQQIQVVNPSGDVQLRLTRGSRLGPTAELKMEDLLKGKATGPYFHDLVSSFVELQEPAPTPARPKLFVPE